MRILATLSGIGAGVATLLFSACSPEVQEPPKKAIASPVVERVMEEDKVVEVIPAAHIETEPAAKEIVTIEVEPKVPSTPAAPTAAGEVEIEIPEAPEPPKHIILQDGVDAFLGYQRIEVPESLSGTYPALNKGIVAFIMAFNLRDMANEEGVSAWAKIRTSAADETTWQYELTYLPDDSVYAVDYKVYFEKLETGYQIARIGHRVKCYRGDNPKQWTVELCP